MLTAFAYLYIPKTFVAQGKWSVLLVLKEPGELDYNGRSSITPERIDQEAIHHADPVLGYVAYGEGQEKVEEVIEYVRLPESLVGAGEFFVLISKGDSMIEDGIHQGDHVAIRKQNTANIGDYVVALYNGLNNIKELAYEDNRSCQCSVLCLH